MIIAKIQIFYLSNSIILFPFSSSWTSFSDSILKYKVSSSSTAVIVPSDVLEFVQEYSNFTSSDTFKKAYSTSLSVISEKSMSTKKL